ncbi:MAG: hypothetical protein BA870_04320 [Desulfuromonadales bacterium C00003094]|jgi:hypothetical protein|nr:MAG: hypothetical protein BA870_04320 [Desulfuromonadales bacterium C00003094]OEU74685.1 MAG: hypothetical protein BA869_07675 [Desulfuromonadales bacterium C00003107]
MIRYLKGGAVLLLFGLGLLLSGCAGLTNWMDSTWSTNIGCNASQVVTDSRQIAILPEAEQRRQVRRLQAAYDKSGRDRDRFLLVCLAVHSKSRYQNHERALQLLQGYRRSAEPREDLLALAELLETLLLQQQQVEHDLAAELERSDSLANKLKALEDIEKIIQEREKKARPSP